eukprot:NODE_16_length_41655_cov_0.272813.p3 type:complete len:659 gc:universal NODE_16_length_41655_cov_0.272813:34370-32394(-)
MQTLSLFIPNPVRQMSSVESDMVKSYHAIQPNLDKLISLDIQPSQCVPGLLYAVLTQFQSSTWNTFLHFHNLHSCERSLNAIAVNFHEMNQNCRNNYLYCVQELSKLNLNIDSICVYLIRQLENYEMVEFFSLNLEFIRDNKVTSQIILSFFKIIQNNLIDSKREENLKELIIKVYNAKPIVFSCLCRELFNLSTSFIPQILKNIPLIDLQPCSSSQVYISQLPMLLEDKLLFLLNVVPYSNKSTHIQWMCDTINELPLWNLRYAIRFICCVIHPNNELLAKPIVHRWMFIVDLYQSLKLTDQRNVLLDAIVYDFYFYSNGEIMNIEPAAFLLFPSDSKFINISNAAWDSLKSNLTNPKFNHKSSLSSVQSAFCDIIAFKLVSNNRLNRALTVLAPKNKDYYQKIMDNKLLSNTIDLRQDDLYNVVAEDEINLDSTAKFFITKFNKIINSDDKLGQDYKELRIYDMFNNILKINPQYYSSCFQEFSIGLASLPRLPLKLFDKLLLLEMDNLKQMLEFAKHCISYNLYRMEQSDLSDYLLNTPLSLVKANLNFLFDSQKYKIFNDFICKMVQCATEYTWELLMEYVNPKLLCSLKMLLTTNQEALLINPVCNFDFLYKDDAVKYLICDLVFFEAKICRNYPFLLTCLEKWSSTTVGTIC